jgi:hypothetical protein
MKNKEIKEGEIYMFVATEDPNRKHLEGKPFTVSGTKNRYTYKTGKPVKARIAFLNENGDVARADELETMPETLPLCTGCNKRPEDIPEYAEAAFDDGISPDDYVKGEEGTYNAINGHFLCTDCYIKAGMPTAPGGWVAP